jgi:alpha-1,3-glucan synthase
MTTKHLLHQFKSAIHDALNSKPETRALMRARSGKQRFPVAQWIEDLEKLQTKAIDKHKKHSQGGTFLSGRSWIPFIRSNKSHTSDSREEPEDHPESDGLGDNSSHPSLRLSTEMGSHHIGGPTFNLQENSSRENSAHSGSVRGHALGDSENDISGVRDPLHSQWPVTVEELNLPAALSRGYNLSSCPQQRLLIASSSGSSLSSALPSGASSPSSQLTETAFVNNSFPNQPHRSSSVGLLSVESITKEKENLNLQKVNPSFTDSTSEYSRLFESKLEILNGKNSEDQLCIEEFLSRSERDWFNRYRYVKMGRSPGGTPASSIFKVRVHSEDNAISPQGTEPIREVSLGEEFPLPRDYVPPSGLKRLLLYRFGDWPVYSLLLACVSVNDLCVHNNALPNKS